MKALVLIFLPLAAAAQDQHDPLDPGHWYPQECCSMKDCFPVKGSEVRASSGGWVVESTGETIPYGLEMRTPSGADGFHRCSYTGARDGGTRKIGLKFCFWAPEVSG